MSDLISYFEQYALLSLEKQEKLARLIGDHFFELDLDAGVARFSDGFEFPAQVLGTESDNSLTWLWAWAEEQTEIPQDLIRSSLEMQEWGRNSNVPECTVPSVDIGIADGPLFSLVASQVCGASCYYRNSYEGGSLFLLLFSPEIDRQPSLNADELARVFADLVSVYDFNHRHAFAAYLQNKKLPNAVHASFVTGELESGEDVRANFDESGRILSFNGKPFVSAD